MTRGTHAFAVDQPYGWTISASSTDPFVNTTTATFGVDTFYLWLACCDVPDYPNGAPRAQGMTAAEFDIAATGITPLAFQPAPPCFGTEQPSVIWCPSCPCGPVLVGTLLVLNLPGSLCFAPSAANGVIGTIDCESSPELWGMDWIGMDTSGAAEPCAAGAVCDKPVSVQEERWGRVKSIYR